MNTCSHCGGRIIDADVTIHESCLGPALVERRRLRAEIAARLLPEIMDAHEDSKELARLAVDAADALLNALAATPDLGAVLGVRGALVAKPEKGE